MLHHLRFLPAFTACVLALGACSDQVDIPADVIMALETAPETGSHVGIGINLAFEPARALYLRLNGKDVWIDYEDRDPERYQIFGGGAHFVYLPPGDYLTELVDETDQGLAVTPPLPLMPQRLQDLTFYETAVGVEHIYWSEEYASLPTEKLRVITANLADQRAPAQLKACLGGELSAPTECHVVKEAIAFGEQITFEVDDVENNDAAYLVWTYPDNSVLRGVVSSQGPWSDGAAQLVLTYHFRDCGPAEEGCIWGFSYTDALVELNSH